MTLLNWLLYLIFKVTDLLIYRDSFSDCRDAAELNARRNPGCDRYLLLLPTHDDLRETDLRPQRNKRGKSRHQFVWISFRVDLGCCGYLPVTWFEWLSSEILLSDCVSFLFTNLISSLECVLVCLDKVEYSLDSLGPHVVLSFCGISFFAYLL